MADDQEYSIAQRHPGYLTGTILGSPRGGETAPILFTVAAFYLPRLPKRSSTGYGFAVSSIRYIDAGAQRGREIRYGTAFVLLMLVLSMNLVAIVIRYKFRKKKNGTAGP
jgi:phosphate transport system permease protein